MSFRRTAVSSGTSAAGAPSACRRPQATGHLATLVGAGAFEVPRGLSGANAARGRCLGCSGDACEAGLSKPVSRREVAWSEQGRRCQVAGQASLRSPELGTGARAVRQLAQAPVCSASPTEGVELASTRAAWACPASCCPRYAHACGISADAAHGGLQPRWHDVCHQQDKNVSGVQAVRRQNGRRQGRPAEAGGVALWPRQGGSQFDPRFCGSGSRSGRCPERRRWAGGCILPFASRRDSAVPTSRARGRRLNGSRQFRRVRKVEETQPGGMPGTGDRVRSGRRFVDGKKTETQR